MNQKLKFSSIVVASLLLGACNNIGTNQPPIADAGENQTVNIDDYIIVKGSGRDVDGYIAGYTWQEGVTVLATTSFFHYKPTLAGVHHLVLYVTDNQGTKASDSIDITVRNTTNLSEPTDPNTPILNPTPTTPVTNSSYFVKNLGTSSRISEQIDLGTTPKSLYLVLSNSASSATTPTLNYTIGGEIFESERAENSVSQKSVEESDFLHHPSYVDEFNAQVPLLLEEAKNNKQEKAIEIQPRREDRVGESQTFYLNQYYTQSTSATARKIVSNVATAMGTKTLNIWVSDDSFGSGCAKAKCVTQEMVDALANTFLKVGLDNDIYDWVTNIYGEEWGSDTNLIGANDEITILLTDIDNNNNPNSGVIGFFWSKDNFNKTFYRSSNERVMFYIDSLMFANESSVWSIDDPTPKEVVSTLAHEFQHMISFYQKTALRNVAPMTWLDEMLSETTEDIVATKIKHTGPRGVAYTDGSAGYANNSRGRYPLYNANNTLSLTDWTKQLADYSKVSAFGTYLIRHYGGATLLHDMLHNDYSDEGAVVSAVQKTANGANKTFGNLLAEWGEAVMLSSETTLSSDLPIYNKGYFTQTLYNGISYDMGSINFFNYTTPPKISTTLGSIAPKGNYFYKIGDNLSGKVSLNLILNGETEAIVIAK